MARHVLLLQLRAPRGRGGLVLVGGEAAVGNDEPALLPLPAAAGGEFAEVSLEIADALLPHEDPRVFGERCNLRLGHLHVHGVLQLSRRLSCSRSLHDVDHCSRRDLLLLSFLSFLLLSLPLPLSLLLSRFLCLFLSLLLSLFLALSLLLLRSFLPCLLLLGSPLPLCLCCRGCRGHRSLLLPFDLRLPLPLLFLLIRRSFPLVFSLLLA
mmetsp:Transcript_19205/g.73782  ORF Transcript_19205/g.73782 Transcript_19205/m.73782 type:complete len:210 (+) Transcript_19205:593-1222(+)